MLQTKKGTRTRPNFFLKKSDNPSSFCKMKAPESMKKQGTAKVGRALTASLEAQSGEKTEYAPAVVWISITINTQRQRKASAYTALVGGFGEHIFKGLDACRYLFSPISS